MDKLRLTQQLLTMLPELDRPLLTDAIKHWWKDLRYDGYETTHLRLTAAGHEVFQALDIEHWCYDLTESVTAGHLLSLSNYMTCPYYLNFRRVLNSSSPEFWIYGSREAVMFGLVGNLDRFVAMLGRE